MSAISLDINGKTHSLDVDPDTPLLWLLRDNLGLTGTNEDRMKYALQVGASIRERLIATAAEQWSVPAAEIDASNSVLTHRLSGRSLRYGDVAAQAVGITLADEPSLKPQSEWTFLGKARPGKLQLPNIADHYWQAKKALDVLPVEWDLGSGQDWRTIEQVDEATRAILDEGSGTIVKAAGDVDTVESDKIVEATYLTPFCEHMAMEPLNATAFFSRDKLEVWYPGPDARQAYWVAIDESGFAPEKVFYNQTLVGGGFGRRTFAAELRSAGTGVFPFGYGFTDAAYLASGAIPNVRITSNTLKMHLMTGAYRAPCFNAHAFAVETLEGATIFGLNMTLNEEITLRDGVVAETNFHEYPMVKLADTPKINIHFEALSGHDRFAIIGEAAVGPVGPAIGNAIYQATGKRLRTTPFRKHDLSWS